MPILYPSPRSLGRHSLSVFGPDSKLKGWGPQPLRVRDAHGHQTSDGGIAYRGRLMVGNLHIATFSNEGRGGCTEYLVSPYGFTEMLFALIGEEARAEFPDLLEPLDHYVGLLWDADLLRVKVPAKDVTGGVL